MRMIKKTLKDSEKHISYGDLKGIECPTCARINKKNPGEQDQKKYEWMMLAIPFPTPKFLKRSFHATPKFQISKPPRVIMKVEHGSSSSGEICISTAGVVRVLGFCWITLDPTKSTILRIVFWSWRFLYGIYTWQPLGPLLKVKLLLGYMYNPTKIKGAKGVRLT